MTETGLKRGPGPLGPVASPSIYDVIVIGGGPVGMALAAFLGQAGRRVRLVDTHQHLYGHPRAAHFDHEVARVLAALGLREAMPSFSEPAGEYDWHNADGELLLHFDWSGPSRSAWPTASMFSQAALETHLDALLTDLPSVEVTRGREATGVAQTADGVQVQLRDTHGEETSAYGQYVVGCDGANSFVKSQTELTTTDLGYFYDWLICDVLPAQPREWHPVNLQVCDPERPTSVLSGGPGRRRWEFMRTAGETVQELNTAESAWGLLSKWDINAGNAVLERHAVYTFQARWADGWRDARVLLAGDAAHQMPPFAGQGLCSGLRDVVNLAWKLDLVLAGVSDGALLDSYTSERLAHVRHAIELSMELGKVICELDPTKVAERDRRMISAGGDPAKVLPPLPEETLGVGVVASVDGALLPPAGRLSFQGYVRDRAGSRDRFDAIVGAGFRIIVLEDPAPYLNEQMRRVLNLIGGRFVRVLPRSANVSTTDPEALIISVIDADDIYVPHLRELGHAAVIVRPDFYIYGAAGALADLDALMQNLAVDLQLRELA